MAEKKEVVIQDVTPIKKEAPEAKKEASTEKKEATKSNMIKVRAIYNILWSPKNIVKGEILEVTEKDYERIKKSVTRIK